MADFMKAHGLESHVYAMDIDSTYLDKSVKERDDITCINGDSNKIEEAFTPDMLKALPHPWVIIEDAHINVLGVMEYLDKFTKPDDYMVIEDTNPESNTKSGCGLLEDAPYEPTGPWKIDIVREFMKNHGEKYRVDPAYSDLFGYNTVYFNSIICKIQD